MKPDLVVFDCDGVLVDTEGPIFEVIAASVTRYGLPISPHEGAQSMTGRTIEQLRDRMTEMGAQLPANWIDEIYDGINTRIAEGVQVFDGALDLINALEALDVPVFVASNGTMARMERSLGPCGIWDRLSGRIMSCETFAAKPDPAMINHAMVQTGVRASHTVMIDDSVPGCRAGLGAGVRTIGFATEGQDATLAALGAEVANSMADVRRLILGQYVG